MTEYLPALSKLLFVDTSGRLPVLVENAGTAKRHCDPAETLRMVDQAAKKIESLELSVQLAHGQARELLRRTGEERGHIQADLQAARCNADIWQQRALQAEASVDEAKSLIWNEMVCRKKAEDGERMATQRAEAAEARCEDMEMVLVRIMDRLYDVIEI